jgi:hypothetical protein
MNVNLDFPQAVVTKQKAFVALLGNSSVPIKELEPNFYSFIINTPQAIGLSIARPYLSDVRHILSLAAFTETYFLLLLFFIFLFWRKRNGIQGQSLIFIYFCVFLSFSVLITIGYVVNNIGAIVRYRSIVLPLLLTPVFCGINWQKLNNLINIKNKNNVSESANFIH